MYRLLERYKITSLHIMVLILGLTGVFGKLIELNSLNLVWYRMLIAFIALFIFLLYEGNLLSINKKDFINLLGIGSIVTFHWIFFFASIKESSVSVAVVCLSTSSLFSAFIEPIFFKRKIIKYEVIMSIIVIFAIIYILGMDKGSKIGYVYGIISAFLGTIFTLFNAKYLQRVEASKITMIEMLSGVIIIPLIFIINKDISINNLIEFPSFNDSFLLIILGVLCTAMVFVWMTEIMRHVSPYSLIMAINLEPIYSIILALIIFKEEEYMSGSFYLGAIVIISVVFLESYFKNRLSK